MAYTPSPIRPKTLTNFSGLVPDGNRNAMTGALGNAMQTQDISASIVASPVVVGTVIATLAVPNNAVALTMVTSTTAIQVSEDATLSEYFTLPINTVWSFEVARQEYMFLKALTSTAVNFYFTTI